jgi:beta-mannosidase
VDVPIDAPAQERRSLILVSELLVAGSRLALAVTPFVPDKQLTLGRPTIETSVAAKAGRATARLRSDSLARWVELSLDGADVVFEDNYVDLPAGRELSIGFDLPEGWNLARARKALRVRSVVDTYE